MACPPRIARRRGFYAVEFAIVLTGSLALLVPVAEFLRLSLFDQTLARATHLAAQAASESPGTCEDSVKGAFQPREGETLIGWLLDAHDDGAVGVSLKDGWPSADQPADEVRVAVDADDDATNGLDWDPTVVSCGTPGAWIRVRSRVVVMPWSPVARAMFPDGFSREHVSWARNQLSI